MGFENIFFVFIIFGILFIYFDYKRKLKSLKSFKGLGKLTKLTNDVNFCKEEKEIFLLKINNIGKSNWNNLFFVTVILFLTLYISEKFYLYYGLFLMDIEIILVILKLRTYISFLRKEFI